MSLENWIKQSQNRKRKKRSPHCFLKKKQKKKNQGCRLYQQQPKPLSKQKKKFKKRKSRDWKKSLQRDHIRRKKLKINYLNLNYWKSQLIQLLICKLLRQDLLRLKKFTSWLLKKNWQRLKLNSSLKRILIIKSNKLKKLKILIEILKKEQNNLKKLLNNGKSCIRIQKIKWKMNYLQLNKIKKAS